MEDGGAGYVLLFYGTCIDNLHSARDGHLPTEKKTSWNHGF